MCSVTLQHAWSTGWVCGLSLFQCSWSWCSVVHTVTLLFSWALQKIIRNSTETVLGLIGFILHCVLARWYKLRVRNEEYDVHRVVEEVYDRYLSRVR